MRYFSFAENLAEQEESREKFDTKMKLLRGNQKPGLFAKTDVNTNAHPTVIRHKQRKEEKLSSSFNPKKFG